MNVERMNGVPRIGLHAPIAGGLQNALLKAHTLGCDAVQIFSRNPRGWMARPLTDEEIERFLAVRVETRISPVVIHCNYLVNLAAANPEILEKSGREAMRRIAQHPKLSHAAFLLSVPGDDARNFDALRSFVKTKQED